MIDMPAKKVIVGILRGGIKISNRLRLLYALIMLLVIVGGLVVTNRAAYAQQLAKNKVEAITVSVKTDASLLPSRVAKKMSLSIEAVGQQILLGRSVDEVAQNKESYERLVKEIFDRVLSGYSVSKVTITPLETARIDVVITPWNDVVGSVIVEMDFGALPPKTIQIIKEDIGDMETQINDILIGLPVEAVEWAGVMTKSVLREYLVERLPEFRPNFDLTGGQKTVLKISLTPNGSVVKDVNVTTASNTIPNILITRLKTEVKEVSESMIGLPVAFVDRHHEYFARSVKDSVDNSYFVKRYGLTTEPTLAAGVVCEVKIGVETNKYLINIEGYLDMGRANDKDNTSAMLHLGKVFGAKDRNEFFLETRFVPSTVSLDFEPGLGRKITRKSSLEFRYDLSENEAKIRLSQELRSGFTIRIERIPKKGQNGVGLRYKIHELLSVEYIVTNDDNWFRLIGHM